jgi:hypothetical protein
LDRPLLAVPGLLLLTVTLLYVRNLFPFTFGVATAAAFVAIPYFLRSEFGDLILRTIGLTSMIYVPFDIFSDTIQWSTERSDTRMLAEEFGGATILWGALWLAASLATIALTLRLTHGQSNNVSLRHSVLR